MKRSVIETARAQAMNTGDRLVLNAIRVSLRMGNTLLDVDTLNVRLQEFVNKSPAAMRQAAV